MKRFRLYLSILGFNFFVACASFLIWYYATDSHVEIAMQVPPNHAISPIGGYYGDLATIPLLESTISQFESQLEKCDTKLGECQMRTTLSVPNYQLNSLMETIRLAKDETKQFGYFAYNYRGWVDYQHLGLQVFVTVSGHYANLLFFGIASSAAGTLAIILAWKKSQHKANAKSVLN